VFGGEKCGQTHELIKHGQSGGNTAKLLRVAGLVYEQKIWNLMDTSKIAISQQDPKLKADWVLIQHLLY